MEQIIKIIDKLEVDGWLIEETKTSSAEYFFLKDKIDMNRGKDVHYYYVTLYKDFEDDQKYRGSSKVKLSPQMEAAAIEEALGKTALAASFVKNPWYPLVDKQEEAGESHKTNLKEKALTDWAPDFIKALYQEDQMTKGGINSTELFINAHERTLRNSHGLHVTESYFTGQIELIVQWKEEGLEEVELFEVYDFSAFDQEGIVGLVKQKIDEAKERANASKMPALKDLPVILVGSAVPEFMEYFAMKSYGRMVYEGLSDWKIGDKIVPEEAIADPLTFTIQPILYNSSKNHSFDEDGFILKPVTIIENSQLSQYHMPVRYAHYLEQKPTGDMRNMVVMPGKTTMADWMKKPYLLIKAFSSFQMDVITGEFGGEVRLGEYYDGEVKRSVSGGSVTGNVNHVLGEMKLSKDEVRLNNYQGPKGLRFKSVVIAGQ